MHKSFEQRKAHHDTTGPAMFDPHRTPNQIEARYKRKHAQNGAAADQAQRNLIKKAPVTAARLFERAGSESGMVHSPRMRFD